MITEDDILAALDKPRNVHSIQKLVAPSLKTVEPLQELLLQMRSSGRVKFDIKTGYWRKA